MSRNAEQWMQQPKLPQSHFVDSRIYTDEAIFREEQQKVFNKSWIIGCHESELPGAFDYRTFTSSGRNAADHRARRGHAGAQLLQRLPAPRQHAALRSRRQREAHHLHFSFVVIRHQGQLRRHHARGAGVPETLLQGGCRAARGARRDRLRRLRVGQSRRQRVHAQGIHRRRDAHARGAHVDAARGVPLPQGDRQHQLQALARHEQRVLSRLLALLQSRHRHAAAGLLRAQVCRAIPTGTPRWAR